MGGRTGLFISQVWRMEWPKPERDKGAAVGACPVWCFVPALGRFRVSTAGGAEQRGARGHWAEAGAGRGTRPGGVGRRLVGWRVGT